MKKQVSSVQLYSETSRYVAIARENNASRNYTRSSIKSRDRLIHALQNAGFRFTPFSDGWGAFRYH